MKKYCKTSENEDLQKSPNGIHAFKISHTTYKILFGLCDTISTVLLVVLALQLLLSGDVELNPGPSSGSNLALFQTIYCSVTVFQTYR